MGAACAAAACAAGACAAGAGAPAAGASSSAGWPRLRVEKVIAVVFAPYYMPLLSKSEDCECESIPHLSRIGRSTKTNAFSVDRQRILRNGGGSHIASRRNTSFWTNGCFYGHHMWVEKT
jgi:hypothetical protein